MQRQQHGSRRRHRRTLIVRGISAGSQPMGGMPTGLGTQPLWRGLRPPSVTNGLLVAYATQANDVANDGTGRNSPFTSAFLRHVGTPDIDLRQMMFQVQDDVYHTTDSRQRPEVSSSIVGEFKLKTAVAVPQNVSSTSSVTSVADRAE